jgi:glutathione peroxidase
MSLYQLTAASLDATPADLAAHKGKVTLVVNVASACGLTPQYTALQQLHTSRKAKGFAVLAFPSNDFGAQEPGSPAQIREFCSTKYRVDFPMFAKVQTKAGPGQSPVYAFLQKATGKLPGWNFGKYLVGRDGKVLAFFEPTVAPDDPALLAAIDQALG